MPITTWYHCFLLLFWFILTKGRKVPTTSSYPTNITESTVDNAIVELDNRFHFTAIKDSWSDKVEKNTNKDVRNNLRGLAKLAPNKDDIEGIKDTALDARNTLIDFYYATNGKNWLNHTKWLTVAPLSKWYGVVVDSNDAITEINLNGNNLRGTISSSIYNLQRLSQLNIQYNFLFNTIPTTIGLLGNLQTLLLQNNSLNGTVPSQLSQLVNLKMLDLSNNSFSGRLSASTFGFLSNLLYLKAANLPNLCYENAITAYAPTESFKDTSRCQGYEDIALCALLNSTNIYTMISKLNLITSTTFSSSHPIPSTFNSTTYYSATGTSKVAFSIKFDSWTSLCSEHKLKFCSDAKCSSKTTYESYSDVRNPSPLIIKDAFGFYIRFVSTAASTDTSCSDMYEYWGYKFTVSYSALPQGWECGNPNTVEKIPGINFEKLGVLTSQSYAVGDYCLWTGLTCEKNEISSLSFSKYYIDGTIPSALGYLTSLTSIWLSFNSFRGTIPEFLGNLARLQYLDLSSNLLSGTIPAALSTLSSLRVAYLMDNDLHGSIPLEFTQLNSTLIRLSLSRNQLSGKLSRELCALSSANIDVTLNTDIQCYEQCWSNVVKLQIGSEVTICSPTSQPSSSPSMQPSSSPSSNPTNPSSIPSSQPSRAIAALSPRVPQPSSSSSSISTEMITYISSAFGGFLLLILAYFGRKFYFYSKRRAYVHKFLKDLPIHKAIIQKSPLADLLKHITENPQTLHMKDHEENTVADLVLSNEYKVDNSAILEVIKNLLPIDPTSKKTRNSEEHVFAWSRIVQDDRFLDVVTAIIAEYRNISYELSIAMDSRDNLVCDVADKKCREVIRRAMYFYNRYDFKDVQVPIYLSETCIVHAAFDMNRNKMPVALKFMSSNESFEKEVHIRKRLSQSSNSNSSTKSHNVSIGKQNSLINTVDVNVFENYFVDVLEKYNIADDKLFKEEVCRFEELNGFVGCIVMPMAEKSLMTIMSTERIVGVDMKAIKRIASDIAEALHCMHSKNIMHGDITPNNVMRVSDRYKLIDFDISSPTTWDNNININKNNFVGWKSSLAYTPPELLVNVDGVIMLKKFHYENDIAVSDNVGYTLTVSHPSYDAWSFGVLLFNICTRELSLFHQNDKDEIFGDDIEKLFSFEPVFIQRKLEKIKDKWARNLISQLLVKDPNRRANMSQVLAHPFLNHGSKPTRMIGEVAEFDVFISYRVASDSHHAQIIYDLLTSRGVKVWWDKVCLQDGVPWEEGFCNGLIKSKIFLPLLSRNALNNSSYINCNLSKLTKDSACDNVLLEYTLALEFRERGLLDFIFPLMIGDELLKSDFGIGVAYGNYFRSGCHPILSPTEEVTVTSVIDKASEHLAKQCLGTMLQNKLSVKEVLDGILANQGYFVEGLKSVAFQGISEKIQKMLIPVIPDIKSPISAKFRRGFDSPDVKKNVKLQNTTLKSIAHNLVLHKSHAKVYSEDISVVDL